MAMTMAMAMAMAVAMAMVASITMAELMFNPTMAGGNSKLARQSEVP